MKRILTLLFLGLALCSQLHAQFGLPPGFNVKEFQKNEQLANWFLEYDSIWQKVTAFDSKAAFESAHLCIPNKKEGWTVVTGKLDSSGIHHFVVYAVDNKGRVEQKKKTDSTQFMAMGCALWNANKLLSKVNVRDMNWIKFVRLNEDLSITVWAFCDTGTNGTIWYGPEYNWFFAPDGKTLRASKNSNRAPLMAGKTAQGLNLSCPADKMPSIGTMFIALRWRSDYKEVHVAYKTGVSTMYFNKAQHFTSWEHVAN